MLNPRLEGKRCQEKEGRRRREIAQEGEAIAAAPRLDGETGVADKKGERETGGEEGQQGIGGIKDRGLERLKN
jgi:hypothetical protein